MYMVFLCVCMSLFVCLFFKYQACHPQIRSFWVVAKITILATYLLCYPSFLVFQPPPFAFWHRHGEITDQNVHL